MSQSVESRLWSNPPRSRGGAADGATVDADGNVWRAQVYICKINRSAPDGSLGRVIDMPVKFKSHRMGHLSMGFEFVHG